VLRGLRRNHLGLLLDGAPVAAVSLASMVHYDLRSALSASVQSFGLLDRGGDLLVQEHALLEDFAASRNSLCLQLVVVPVVHPHEVLLGRESVHTGGLLLRLRKDDRQEVLVVVVLWVQRGCINFNRLVADAGLCLELRLSELVAQSHD